MTVIYAHWAAATSFVAATIFGLLEALNSPNRVALRFDLRGQPTSVASRWVAFGMVEFVEAILLFGLFIGPSPRPEAAVRAGAVILTVAIWFCAYIQGLIFKAARSEARALYRPAFWVGVAVFVGIIIVANAAAPYLP